MSEGCTPGTERTHWSLRLCLDIEWLEKALKHAKESKYKSASVVIVHENEKETYKVCDGIGEMLAIAGCGDWEPMIRDEYHLTHPSQPSQE